MIKRGAGGGEGTDGEAQFVSANLKSFLWRRGEECGEGGRKGIANYKKDIHIAKYNRRGDVVLNVTATDNEREKCDSLLF